MTMTDIEIIHNIAKKTLDTCYIQKNMLEQVIKRTEMLERFIEDITNSQSLEARKAEMLNGVKEQ